MVGGSLWKKFKEYILSGLSFKFSFDKETGEFCSSVWMRSGENSASCVTSRGGTWVSMLLKTVRAAKRLSDELEKS